MSRYRIAHPVRPYATHSQLIRSIGRNQCVLDVGCNEGYIGSACDKSNTFYGIDYDQAALAVAKNYYKDVACVDLNQITALPWDRKFDVMMFGDVLEHLYSPRTTLKVLVENYLKPGGKVVISVPNIANWVIRIQLLLGKFDYQETGILDRTHLHFFTYKSARDMFEFGTLQIIRVSGGSNIFGAVIQHLPFTKGLLAHSIILELVSVSTEAKQDGIS